MTQQTETPERGQAEAVKTRYTHAVKALTDNADLNDTARRRLIAEQWQTARQELDALRTSEHARLDTRQTHLMHVLFGAPDGADAISTRDAADRAERLSTPDEAALLLARAQRNNDEVLARAVAHHAMLQSETALSSQARRWESVAAAYFDSRPRASGVIEELAHIERLKGASRVLTPYSLPQPFGVTPADINTARQPAATGSRAQLSRSLSRTGGG